MHLTVNFAELFNGINIAPVAVIILGAAVAYALAAVTIMLFLKGSK